MFKSVNGGKLPTRGTSFSACVDLYANESVTIYPGETHLIPLGVAIDLKKLEDNYFTSGGNTYTGIRKGNRPLANIMWKKFKSSHYLQLMLRSSLGKKGLIIPNGVGIIDIDYKDEIKILICNPISNIDFNLIRERFTDEEHYSISLPEPYHIKKGDRIAQITLLEHKSYLMDIHADITRNGGFGSTGDK